MIGLLVLMIFFTGLSLFLSTEKGQQYVKNQVSSFLSDQYDLDIKIDHVKIDLLKHLVFEKTTIVKDNETLLSCDKLFVKTNLVSLLSGILNIDELGIEGAEVDISKLLAQIPKKSKPKNRNSSSKLPIEIGIKEIHLRRIKTQFKIKNNVL